ncbi:MULTISPECIES: nucleotide sugar dehydrogenase [Bradyrhizobium]|uniref:UDP-N-acetyl-D-galactosamine dehydrogenase n=1 Tax=Bradyrhizobium elkanii TaxID=29448 RepID=A0A8I1YBJ9_BRAEL|nr:MULTISPECIES: nucleotide sugar dehydrogenase [Bradyrhizobium]MBP1295800.1 UDP-N-acetyl-D-galactosamine dehydrogenase [Bradyrhizobium elkanii]MCA1401021.1 nucleotide sugar dehydrogenase [Bradyrhizobium sp. BRP56]MCP1933301.1 UDP-N-acetyl-D-galactosamine dehydrogenase [Bradyrhizobium elkanii]MCS3478690.1 UDP-N-acetyl-D-galactosamine dehydrogenase [Bradyrhizobium elkanii]MCS3585465.1 UDP-N-acetyl-D-galactosamine dehydrogenase [Bradyrhizobium elkanii]
MSHSRKIAVIGLGYVGLPVAVAFARKGIPVVGFDVDTSRVAELSEGFDRTREVDADDLRHGSLTFSVDPAAIRGSDFFIVTVPTPIDDANRPDLGAMIAASRTVGSVLKKGDIIVYESTVYPGAIEEECIPILAKVSDLKPGVDFAVGYSPERINPGDKLHRFETIMKVVSAQDPKTLDIVADVYGSVVTAGIHRAPSIKVAEAAKVIENTQRDLNIAFMNELSLIFQVLNIDTGDVLAAAGTKWNFLPFQPGLVGGHCIGVDPYYLTFRAERAGYHPEVILAGRRINDGMGQRIARECVRMLLRGKGRGGRSTVTVLGLTFKENVPDTRNSRVVDIIRELETFGIHVQVHDPLANAEDARHEYGLTLTDLDALGPADAVILAVAHDSYLAGGWPLFQRLLDGGTGLILDVKAKLDRSVAPAGIELWRL